MKNRKSILFLFLLLFIFISCNNREDQNKYKNKLKQNSTKLLIEPDTIYNVDLANKLWSKQDTVSAVVIDTACIKAQKRAQTDIKNGKLIYFNPEGWWEWKEMAELLCQYNVEYKNYLHSCFGPPPGFQYNCYKFAMREAVYDKIGEKEMDSLWNLAEKMFVLKHPDSVYMKTGIDVRTKYIKIE